MKIGLFSSKRKMLIQQHDVLRSIYKLNNAIQPESVRALDCAKNSQRLFKLFLTLYMMNGFFILIWPFVSYLWHGELYTDIYHQILGVDSSTPIGFTMKLIYNAYAIVILVLSFSYFDGIYAIYAYNVRMFSDLIVHQIGQLNGIIENEHISNDKLRIRITFRNIIQMHCEMIE